MEKFIFHEDQKLNGKKLQTQNKNKKSKINILNKKK